MSADHAYGPPGPKVTNHVQAPCPSCGHCPTCGRGGYRGPWITPYNPWPGTYIYCKTRTAAPVPNVVPTVVYS